MRFSSGAGKNILFTLGHGYVADRLAEKIMPEGWRVIGTTRSPDKAAALVRQGVEPVLLGDGTDFVPPEGAAWLVSTPPKDGRCPGADLFARHATAAGWIGYLCTTAVYGNRDGGWCLEDTAPSPTSPRGEARLAAEGQWLSSGGPVEIFRLPGIYGPGRSALDRVQAEDARIIDKPGQVFSRVHVDDIVSGLIAAMTRPETGRISHLVDDWPCAPGDPLTFAAELLGIAPPPRVDFESAEMSAMARSFYSENKRIGNGRTKAALGWRPRYRTYREGLRAVLEAQN